MAQNVADIDGAKVEADYKSIILLSKAIITPDTSVTMRDKKVQHWIKDNELSRMTEEKYSTIAT